MEVDLLTRTLDACNAIAGRLDGRPLGGMSREEFFVLFQFVKAFKSAQAIRLLFLNGYEEDAEMLLRVVAEQAIIVRWVRHEDSDARTRAYALHLKYNRLRILAAAQPHVPDSGLAATLIEEIEREGAEYRALPNSEKWLTMTRDVAAMAADAGIPQSYAVHLNGTNLIHSNPIRERAYVRDRNDTTHFNAAAAIPDDGWTPVLTATHVLLIAQSVAELFQLGVAADLKRIGTELDGYQPRQE